MCVCKPAATGDKKGSFADDPNWVNVSDSGLDVAP